MYYERMGKLFLVSSDCAAIFGDMNLVKYLWGSVLLEPNCKGVELIGWRWTPQLLKQAKRLNIPVLGVHGRTGGWNEEKSASGKLIMQTLNELFITNAGLVKIAREIDYVLLHRSALTPKTRELLYLHSNKLHNLRIENVIAPNDTELTIQTVEALIAKNLNVGMTFDIVHFLREPYFTEPKLTRFGGLLEVLHKLSSKKFPINIHFPIGTYRGDSLPIMDLSASMWKELADAINRLDPVYRVLENQQSRAYSIYLPEWTHEEVRKRNHWVVDFLKDKDIL